MKSLSISQKLIIFLILISILPYAIISYLNYSAEKTVLEKKALDGLGALAEAKKTHISTIVNFRIQQVQEIATSNFMQEIEHKNSSNLNFNLLRVKNEIPDFFEIFALDINGTVVGSTASGLVNTSYAGEDFFKNAKEALYIGNIDYHDGKTGYTISSPVLNRSTNKFIGIITITIYPRFIYDVTSDYTGLGESGESLLVQKRGNEFIFLSPLRHNPSAILSLRYPLDSSLAKPAILASKGETGTIQALDYRGIEVFAAYTYIPAINLGLVVKTDASEALIPVVKLKERTVTFGIFYLAAVAVLAYLLGRKFTGPLIRLSNASRNVAGGNLAIQIEPESRDEIGELAQAFNVMVIKLRELYGGLEQKVKERTEDLNRKNRTLQTLFEIDRVVSRSLDLDELLRDAISKAIQVTSSDAGWIYLLEKDGETLSLKTYIGISTELASAASKLKVGQGVSGLVVKSGEPVTMYIEKYPYPKLVPLMIKDGVTSLAGTPLIAKGQVVGAMVLSNRKHRLFSKEDIDFLASIGVQIGVAVENARLYSELKHHDKTLETLFEIDRVVSQSLDLDEIFKVALAKTIEVTSSDAGAIYLLEEEGVKLKMKTSMGVSSEFARVFSEIKLGEGIAGIAARNKKPFVTDIEHYPTPGLLPSLEEEGLITLVGTPLMARSRVVGAMNLGYRRRRIISKEDLDVLASIGIQIGVAVENARLYQEVKMSYEKLQAAYDELKSLDRMKSDFLSNVSHELKTPLVSIRGYSELLYDEKVGSINQTQKNSLEAIIRNTGRLLRLINSLLFLSIQQMGKPEIKMKTRPQPIDEVIDASMADMKVQAGKKNIELVKDVPAGLVAIGDWDRLTELFLNLMDNAIKFSVSGGKITIKAVQKEDNVYITVTDTGIGIPGNVIPLLFQRFYQADASVTRKYGGTGLGLYICKNIIDAHNGKIWIESEMGKGTTVHVILPVAK